jgi:hypothetical protein
MSTEIAISTSLICTNLTVRLGEVTPSLQERARPLVGLLFATILLDAIAVVSGAFELQLLTDLAGGEAARAATIEASDSRQQMIELLHVALFITTAIFWVRWFHQSYRNTQNLGGTGFRFPLHQAAWCWFVPIFNLVRPKQLADDIWRASDPSAPANQGETWKTKPVPAWLHVWWFFAMLSGIAGFAGARLVRAGEDVREILTGSWISVVGDLAGFLAAAIAVRLVQRITGRLVERASSVGQLEKG